MGKEPMGNRVIRVPDRLWKAAKDRAGERGETVSEAVRKFLEKYVCSGKRALNRPAYVSPPEPLSYGRGPYGRPVWAHYAEVVLAYKGETVVKCRWEGCDFGGRYSSRADARRAADAHMIFTHVTGGRICGGARCSGCAAVRRVRRYAETSAAVGEAAR